MPNNDLKTVKNAFAAYTAKVDKSTNPANYASERAGLQKEMDAAMEQGESHQWPFPDWDALRKKIDAATAKIGVQPATAPAAATTTPHPSA